MELTNLFKTKNWDCKLIPIGSLEALKADLDFQFLRQKFEFLNVDW